jgi:uncharacterized protein
MTRPKKCRRIQEMPATTYFKPAGIPLRQLAEVILSVEETEALRLKDIDGLDQAAGGEQMNISRPTFQRVLNSARRKLADAVLNGKAIHIEGGDYELAALSYRCRCGHRWQAPVEASGEQSAQYCPVCESSEVSLLPVGGGRRQGQSGHKINEEQQ